MHSAWSNVLSRLPDNSSSGARRPLTSRQAGWAQALARLLLRTKVTPNAISVAGMVFATLSGLAFALASDQPWLFLAGGCIVQLRLACNLLDGMVAVEGGRASATGSLFNEIPDRFADTVILVGFGIGGGEPLLGLGAALLAVFTAYLRALGASFGLGQDFSGPMAKQQRMAAVTLGTIAALVEGLLRQSTASVGICLWIIAVGTLLTSVRRVRRMAQLMEERGG